MSPTFSETLRAATAPAHDVANAAPWITALLGGQLTVAAFGALSSQLYFVYSAIEQAAEAMRDDPVGGKFVFDELTREPALREDMAFYYGPSWESEISPLPSTEEYCARIREVAFTDACAFVAHHYTRYLGDLAGGQVIRHKLKHLYGVTGPGALFYTFDRIPSTPRFRETYRELLNTAPWGPQEHKRVIMESIRGFELNVDIFSDLAKDMARYSLT